MNLGIIIDSASGLTKKETELKGWGFLPLYINIDGKDYAEGIDIDSKSISKILTLKSNVRTSASTPAAIISLFESFSKKYDEVIVISLSTELSSQNSNLKSFAKDFNNINVITSKSLGIVNVMAAEKALKANEQGIDIKAIISLTEKLSASFWGILAPLTLDWLVKGGRVNSRVAAMANMLKIVPLIKLEDGKLDKYGKGRTFKKSIIKAAKAVINEKKATSLMVFHSGNNDIKQIVEDIKEKTRLPVIVGLFPSSITLHIGLGAVAVTTCIN